MKDYKHYTRKTPLKRVIDSLRLRNILLIVLFVAGASELKADVVYLHTVSHHANSASYNEANYGVGIRHYVEKDRYFTVGTYENSEYTRSNYVGYGADFGSGDFKLGLSAGIVTGYSSLPVVPYLVPSLRYKRLSLMFVVYPEPVVHFTIDLTRS